MRGKEEKMNKDILFLDKDSTLGDWVCGDGLYPGAKEFLQHEREWGRELYIVTAAGEPGRVHLVEVDHLLTDYFGGGKIDASREGLYCFPDGTFRIISEDYRSRIWTLPDEERKQLFAEVEKLCDQNEFTISDAEREYLQKQIDDFWKKWGDSININTGESFDETTRYQNPYINGAHMKDLHLARRLISPQDFQQLRTVMVGDRGDADIYSSDPSTPLVVVSKRVREGEWNLVSAIVDLLFDNPVRMMWEMFDGLHTAENVTLQNENYKFERNEWSSRLVYCP